MVIGSVVPVALVILFVVAGAVAVRFIHPLLGFLRVHVEPR
jgi:hypothetical protein